MPHPPRLPCSALHFAAAIGNVKITQMLCQSGADVNLNDKDGASIIEPYDITLDALPVGCLRGSW